MIGLPSTVVFLLVFHQYCEYASHEVTRMWANAQRDGRPAEYRCSLCSTSQCGLSANFRCKSETCCMRLAENTGRKKSPKSPSWHHHTTLSGYIFATKARIDNRKKNLLSSNMFSTCPHNMVNFGPIAAAIGLPVWGTRPNLNGFRVLAVLLHGI